MLEILSKVASLLSEELSELGTTGLTALDYLGQMRSFSRVVGMEQFAQLDAAKASKADPLLSVVAPVRQLVEATASPTPTS